MQTLRDKSDLAARGAPAHASTRLPDDFDVWFRDHQKCGLSVRSPEPDLARDAEWLVPLSLVGPQDTDALAVYFEVYETDAPVPWYRLRAEVVDRETGFAAGVPIRPAGEEGFRPTWDRFPDAGGVTSELLTVSLSDVDRSRLTLRVIVDVPDVGAGVVAQSNLDRREASAPGSNWDWD